MVLENHLPIISDEQQTVINLLHENNVIVNSVPGSGKTTCALYIAKQFQFKKVLLVTYSRKLRIETKEKVIKNGIKNMEVHSYHSFCVNYYHKRCKQDSDIEYCLLKKKMVPSNPFYFDIIIFDETQDVTPLYYIVACKIFQDNIHENKNKVKVCIFGDEKQSIFDYKNADGRFITYGDQLYDFNNISFSKCKLSTSFRLTREISDFINKCMLKEDRIISTKISGKKPKYNICDVYGNTPMNELIYIIEVLKIEYKDIFILAPSLKSTGTPVRRLENRIKNKYGNKIPIFVPTSDESILDSDIIENKLVFSTFHQAKGLERKVTLVFNFDSSYFEFFKTDRCPYVCPNELYVSNSRSTEILILFHHFKKNYLPFLDRNYLEIYSDIEISRDIEIEETSKFYKKKNTAITELIRHTRDEIFDECIKFLTITTVRDIQEKIDIDLRIYQQDSTVELVDDITGTAIPAFYEFTLKGEMSILKILQDNKFEDGIKNIEKKNNNLNSINLNDKIRIRDLLYISNCFNAFVSGYIFKIDQITEYNWINKHQLRQCLNRMNQLNISKNAEFEKSLLSSEPEIKNIFLSGSVDCVDDNNVYEFKCTEKLENKHIIQLALYMYLNKNEETNYYLYNILTGEKLKIECEQTKLKQIVDKLIQTKYAKNELINDDIFLENMLKLKKEYDQ